MPIYDYRCSDCEKEFSVMHSMTEDCTECAYCLSKNIEKVVSKIGKTIDKGKYKSKVGDLVKSHIEETKRDIKQENSKLKNEVYKDD